MSDIAVQVEHLSKMYRLGVINNGTLWQDLQTFFALKFGKEDPNSKIGEDKYSGDKDHFWALKDISFDIKQGDRVGIIGKNGAGKSTLLKLLSRITAPTEGIIKIKGKVASLLEVGTGFHGELTGRENIYLNGAILGMKKRRIDEKLDQIIEFSGIERHIDTPVKRYSSGMFVRLAFAVAAHLDSDILIADEVLAVGDAEFQKKALGKMEDLSTGEGRTVFFVSHNMQAVKNLCNCGILLEKGKITQINNDLKSLIACYIQVDTENIDKNIPWENKGKFEDRNFTPMRIELINDAGETQTALLDYEKPYKLRLTFHVEEYVPSFQYRFDVYFGTEILFMIFSQEIHQGLNIHEWIIPERTFYSGNQYRFVLVGAIISEGKWIIPPSDDSISINITVQTNLNTKLFKSQVIK
jgi:lipopolysaccharide transport system ATP-binding protein